MSNFLNIVVSMKGRELGRFSFAKAEVMVGREKGVDIILDNAGVSRQHACITGSAEGIAVADLQSNNGTFINGTKIESSSLSPGDELRIGKFSLDVRQSAVPFDAGSLSGDGPISATASSVRSGAESSAANRAPAEPVGSDHTVMVSAAEQQKLLREKAAEPVIETAAPSESRGMGRLVIGIAIGVLIAWLLL